MTQRLKNIYSLIIVGACLISCSKQPSRPSSNFGPGSGGGAEADGELGSEDGKGGVIPPGTGASKLVCKSDAPIDPGSTPLRRLSRSQYVNSVKDLLGDLPVLATVLSNQARVMSLGTSLSIPSSGEVSAYNDAAQAIASAFVTNKALLEKSINCASGNDQRACTAGAVEKLVAKAFRARATPDDAAKLMNLYDLGDAVSHERGIELVIGALLQSPRFLYQVELGTDEKLSPKAVKLDDYEVASRLAFALWDGAPDDKLLAAAAAGKLSTLADVREQMAWMLADPKGKILLRRFLESWTLVDDFALKGKDTTLYPEWNDTLKSAIRGQATAFFDHVLANEGGTLEALFGSKNVMVNKDLAAFYGMSVNDAAFKAIEKNDAYTAGIFSLPAILSLNAGLNRSSPTNRGKFVREALLCQHLGTVPADVVNSIDPANMLPTRDAIQQTTSSPKCSGCHKLTDPIGFTFENYDAIGRFRTMEQGVKVDTSGEIFAVPGAEGKINNLAELSEKLSKNAVVQDCLVRQVFRFVKARLEQSTDACSIEQSAAAFKASGSKLEALPAAIIGHESILYRQPIP